MTRAAVLAFLRTVAAAAAAFVLALGRDTWAARAEILTASAIFGGWALITYGIATLTAPIAWAFSFGVLLLSLAGWRLLWRIVTRGLYLLSKPGGRDA